MSHKAVGQLFQKLHLQIYASRFMTSKIIQLPFTCPFLSGKCGKIKKKLLKFEYLENEKSFLDGIKNTS